MPRAFADTDFACWAPEGLSVRIDFAMPVLEEVAAAASDGLARFRHGGMEVGGVLFGEIEDGIARILAFRPLECEHAFGPRFVLSERDRSRLRTLVNAPKSDPALAGLDPVGWYHSHTRSEIALSPRDLEVYDSFFPQRWQVALVIRPEDEGPVRAGFFFREPDGAVRTEASYGEFSLVPRLHGLAAEPSAEEEPAAAEPVAAEPPMIARQREPEPQPPPALPASAAVEPPAAPEPVAVAAAPAAEAVEPTPIEIPSFVQAQPPRRARRGLWLVLALAAAGVAGFALQRYARLGAASQPLSLWVADMGGQLLIEWDRNASAVREAAGATLEIRDGAERTVQKIGGDRLREGSVDYVRAAEMVDVRLRVEGRSGPAEETIMFIGPPVRRTGDAAVAELKSQLESLQKQLQERDAQIGRLRSRLNAAQAPRP